MTSKFTCVVFVLVLSVGSAFAQEARNAARKVEIAWPQYGFLRTAGETLFAGGFDVAVRATDSLAIVGEYRIALDPQGTAGGAVVTDEALITYRGGVRYSKRSGERITTFVQGLVGGATGLDVFSGPLNTGSGFSLGAGGGVDVGLKKWLGLRIIQADYDMIRVGGTVRNGFRMNWGLVFRIGGR